MTFSWIPRNRVILVPPLEQGNLQLLLQIFDVPGQRRLGEMQPLHDARKMQFLRYGQKTLQATGQPDGLCFKLFPRVNGDASKGGRKRWEAKGRPWTLGRSS
jgi:hypothetical protein